MSDERLTNPLLSRQLPGQNGFFISAHTLASLFDPEQIYDGQSLEKIVELGGLEGLMSSLQTSESSGISSASLKSRVSHYGSNSRAKPPLLPKFLSLTNPMFINLMIGSLAILIIRVLSYYQEFSISAVGILGAIILLYIVALVLVYLLDKKLIQRSPKQIKAIRDNKEIAVSKLDLVVGDVLLLEAGNDVPIDALIINSKNLSVSENIVTGKEGQVEKGNQDPFLLDGSQIIQGNALVLALAVGLNTYLEYKIQNQAKLSEKSSSLQVKTRELISMLKLIGKLVGGLALVALIISILINSNDRGWEIQDATQIANAAFISLIIVFIPYAMTSMNIFSPLIFVSQLSKKGNLIKSISSIESLGQVSCICSELNGVILEKDIKVIELYAQGKKIENFSSGDLQHNLKNLLAYLFYLNTNATFSVNKDGTESFEGDRMQIALVKLAVSWGFHYDSTRSPHQILFQFPFNSLAKRIGTVAKINDKVYFFVSDTSDSILKQCKFHFKKSGQIHELKQSKAELLLNNNINAWKSQGYRTSILAYRELSEYEELLYNPELKLEDFEKDLVLLGIAAIGVPLKQDVEKTISTCKEAGITVMLVTRENKEVAINAAKQCGVLPKDYKFSASDNIVLSGPEFQARVKGLIEDSNNPNEWIVNDIYEFSNIMSTMRVMVRANPEVKFLLVTGLRQLNEVAAFAGCEICDAPALSKSNVGFSMGLAESQMARDASDIILLDGRFSLIMTAILLGRNIYNSVSRSIQPLLIASVMLTISIILSIIIKQTLLNAMQMYWVIIIIYVIGANFLAILHQTKKSAINNSPQRYKMLITLDMKKNMIGQIIYQTTVLCFIIFLLPECSSDLFGEKIPNQIDSRKWSIEKGDHFTIFFNCFVLMQIFNLINCNKLKSSALNVLKDLCNWPLMIVITVIAIIQSLVIIFDVDLLNCSKLTIKQHIFCWVVGAGALIFGVFFRFVPLKICYLCCVSSSSIKTEAKSKCSELFGPNRYLIINN